MADAMMGFCYNMILFIRAISDPIIGSFYNMYLTVVKGQGPMFH